MIHVFFDSHTLQTVNFRDSSKICISSIFLQNMNKASKCQLVHIDVIFFNCDPFFVKQKKIKVRNTIAPYIKMQTSCTCACSRTNLEVIEKLQKVANFPCKDDPSKISKYILKRSKDHAAFFDENKRFGAKSGMTVNSL